MTFNNTDEFLKAGFSGFKTIRDLLLESTFIPESSGVYLILNINNKTPDFLSIGTGGHFKGKNPNVSKEELNSNWVNDTKVLYIGKATSLKSRLRQYLRFGQGSNVGHWGGRYIWQLRYSKELVVCWKSMTTEDPRDFEAKLISSFVEHYGRRPFANLAD